MNQPIKSFETIDSITYLKDLIEGDLLKTYSAKDILCLFDIDNTLVQPDTPAAYFANIVRYHRIYHAVENRYKDVDSTWGYMQALKYPQRLVETNSVEFIHSLQEKKVKTLALTATLTGHFDEFKRSEVMRYEELKRFGISFEKTFPQIKDFTLTQCGAYRCNYPVFYHGILCSNGEYGPTDKGKVLCQFLELFESNDMTQMYPRCILLVDDRLQNLKDVRNVLAKCYPKIRFIGLHYRGAMYDCPTTLSAEDFESFWENCFNQAREAL